MTLVLNEEQQMLKESARGFLAEFAPVAELRKQRDAGSETGYGDKLWLRWQIWAGRQSWFPKPMAVWILAIWVWVKLLSKVDAP